MSCYSHGLVRTVHQIPRPIGLGIWLPVSHTPSCIVTTNPSRTGLDPLIQNTNRYNFSAMQKSGFEMLITIIIFENVVITYQGSIWVTSSLIGWAHTQNDPWIWQNSKHTKIVKSMPTWWNKKVYIQVDFMYYVAFIWIHREYQNICGVSHLPKPWIFLCVECHYPWFPTQQTIFWDFSILSVKILQSNIVH